MKESSLGSRLDTPVKIDDRKNTQDRAEQLSSLIAQRAYDLFESEGRTPGRDLDHWFRAEAKLVHPFHMQIVESDDALTVRAEIPGYKADEVAVSVEPRRVTITGSREGREQHETDKIVYTEHCADQIFRAFDLPAEIIASKATATLRDGVLELAMPKVAAVPKARTAAQSA